MFISVACFGSINKAPKHLCYRYTTARTAYAMHLTIHSRKNINPHTFCCMMHLVSSAVTSAAVSDDTEIFSAQGGCAWGNDATKGCGVYPTTFLCIVFLAQIY